MTVEIVASTTKDFESIEESVDNPRIQLHHETTPISQILHELETRHYKLTLGLIALSQTGEFHTREVMFEEHQALATKIAKLRQKQADLIRGMAYSNTQIWRPPYNDDPYDHTMTNKQKRAEIEAPFIQAIYQDGSEPTETMLTSDEHTDAPSASEQRQPSGIAA